MKKNKIKLMQFFLISLLVCGCSSKYVEVQSYLDMIPDYAIGMKTLKKITNNVATVELMYGYDPKIITEEERVIEQGKYNFSLLLQADYKAASSFYSVNFLMLELPLDDFPDQSSAFAKVKKTRIFMTGLKFTFSKKIEQKIDMNTVPNSSGHILLSLKKQSRTEPEDSFVYLDTDYRFTKSDKKIIFTKY